MRKMNWNQRLCAYNKPGQFHIKSFSVYIMVMMIMMSDGNGICNTAGSIFTNMTEKVAQEIVNMGCDE